MKKKTLSMWAIIVFVVFAGTVVLYPMIFNPEDEKPPAAPAEPVAVPAAHK